MMKHATLLLATAATLLTADAASEGKRWWAHIEYLADDALEGRNVGTPGFDKAVTYVSGQFEKIGLKPGGTSGYLQPVKFETRQLVPAETRLALVRDGQEEVLTVGQDASLSARGELDGTIDAPLVFVGYGMSIPEAGWDDYSGVDVRGRVAVGINSPVPVKISDNLRSHLSSAEERWGVAKRAGAIGFATIPAPRATTAAGGAAGRGGRGAGGAGRGGGTGRGADAPQPNISLFDRDLQDQAGMVVAMSITRAGAEKVLAGSGHTLDELDQLVRDGKPLPRFPLTATLRARAAINRGTLESANVIGVLEGSDPKLKAEYVVMSAHLDHMGVGRAVDGDAIYNGAMDDASGVASVIEIARLLKESGARPKRSILFMAQTAEEKGLLGSKYFAARPTVPFKQIVADINLDMFLPLYPLKVIEVQGLTESTLGESVRAAAKALGVDVQTDREPEQNRFIRSDQYSFIRAGIPAMAFKFGYEFGSPEEQIRRNWVRDVYHQPSDDLKQPVNLEAAATFNRVIMGLLQRVADDPARPKWNKDSFFRRFAQPTTAR
jgi:hypothetical protein